MGQIVLTESIQSYLLEVDRYPVLTPDEERDVAVRYFKTRSIEDAHKLVTANLRYVVKIALEYRNYGCRLADLVQEGNIGLMHAVKKFNPFKGFRLITYATWWIRAAMQEFILKSKGLVRRGSKALKRKLFYRKGPAVDAEGGVAPGAARAGYEDPSAAGDLSLNRAVADDDRTTHLDLLCDARPNQEEAVAAVQEEAHVKREVHGALSRLSDRERTVIEKRVMAEEPASLRELGDSLGLTRERVRQIETQALRKLRGSLA